MVVRTSNLIKSDEVKVYSYAVYDGTYSQNDTTALSEFVSTSALKQAFLVKNSDGSEITCTIANNVVTVTGACTDVLCTLFVFGVLA